MDQPMAIPATARDSATAIVRRAQRGELAAFDQLVATRLDRSFRFACSVLGNEHDARDAVQDAYVIVWRELPRLREPERFDAWLGRIVLNSCRQALRHRSRIREISLGGQPFEGLQTRRGQADPARVVERDAIGQALDRLTVDQRAILAMHHLEELSIADIAARLGIPGGTVKWRLHAARRALEQALANEDS
jgi:RNA polymerase sigma-70 factor (ECF subfamily)